ncbi:DUF4328 domain-containing protein [Pseudonocardia sp. TRM90224]|uniref:DUF4328 domain-containing protein n=1 Tax=Pseudonocardia sp. TRM90224 TaxID=2812678 RepID=UPI001E30523B|nr:DUF4328 domain-containing protein [Pseudonocardia sp. TRM90224]
MQKSLEHVRLRATWWGRGTAALAMVAALLMVPAVVTAWAQYAAVRASIRPGVGVSENGASVDTGPFADAVASAPRWDLALTLLPYVVVAATAVMMVWVARVRDDAATLAPHHRFRLSRRFAIGGLAVPFANLWWSRRIVDDLWAARPGAGPLIVRAWRACLIGAFLVSAARSATTFLIEESAAFVDKLVVGVTSELVGSIFYTVEVLLVLSAAVLLAVIVRRIEVRRPEPDTSEKGPADGGRSWPVLTLAMCAVPTLSTAAAGLSLITVALAWSAQGPTGAAFAAIPFMGSFFLFAQAACLAALLVRFAREPHRYATRLTAALCIFVGIDVKAVATVPLLVADQLVAGLVLATLLATAWALRRLERISQ